MNKFAKAANANATHYNNHPVEHLAIMAVYAGVVFVAARWLARRESNKNFASTSGHFAK